MLIDEYIVDGMSYAADVGIPTTTGQLYNHWWDDTLKDLKSKSIDAQNLWKSCGTPTVGDIYNLKRCAKANYKRALRQKTSVRWKN